MNERHETTMTTDEDVERRRNEAVPGDGSNGAAFRTESGPDSGASTAAMSAAMERRHQGGTGALASAMESRTANAASTNGTDTGERARLFAEDETTGFRSRWTDVQTGFVDEPRQAVERADELVAEVIQRLAKVFADERGKLEEQWGRGDDISTEDLRVALQRYRSFFERLLSA